MNSFERWILLLILVIKASLPVHGQSIFDDALIWTQWSKSTIISKSRDTLVAEAKYNPHVNPFKIEIRQGEKSYDIETGDVYSLSYYDENLDSLRLFKNIRVSVQEGEEPDEIFFEIFYDDRYFAITRGLTYSGSFALVNPLAKPSIHLAIFTINKMTGQSLKDMSKKTYISAMSDKEEEIKKYIKDKRIKLYVLDHKILLFKYYSQLRG
jgi:hypothetical protein